jgi:restriction endonuclease S subunit
MTKLPDGWELKRLSDCLEKLKSGKKAERGWSPQCLSHPSDDENVWGVLKTTSVQMGEFQPEYNKELPDSLAPKSGLEVNSGDFLVTTTGPRNRCGIICHVKKTRKKLIFSGKILRFRVNESLILPNWLMYLLMSPEYQSILDKLKVGTSDSSVSIGNQQILDLEIPVPPIDEQSKIVELLEDHLSRLDAALADVKQIKIKAAQFRRALLHSIFNGQVEEFGNKSEWDEFILSEVIQNLDNKRIPVNSKERSTRQGSVPYYGATGQVGTIDVPIFDDDLLLLGEDGVQFFDPSKPKAYLISGPAWVNNHVHVLKAKDSIVNQKLLMHYLNQFNFIGYANGTTRLKLTQGAMNIIPISLPNRRIQDKMLEYIDRELSIVDASLIAADYAAAQSVSLRRALLQSAFTGRLTKEVAVV